VAWFWAILGCVQETQDLSMTCLHFFFWHDFGR